LDIAYKKTSRGPLGDPEILIVDTLNVYAFYQDSSPPAGTKGIIGWPTLYPYNKHFVGRDQELDSLKKFISVQSDTQRICKQSIIGLPGVGKTQLALAYAHHAYGKKLYQAIIWLNREGDEGYFISLHRFATQILKLELNNLDKKASLYKIHEHLLQYPSILLIFDNVKTLNEIHEIIPIPEPTQNNQIHILATSVDPNFATDFEPIELKEFTALEATAYINKILDNPDSKDARLLAEILCFFPLALTQALAYIKLNYENNINKYLELYKKHKIRLLKDDKPFPGGIHAETVWASWTLALQKIMEDYPDEKDKLLCLLNRCAYLAPTGIPKEFLSNWVPEQYELNKCINVLKSYSLISSGKSKYTFDMHGLLQQVIRLKCSKPEKETILFEMANSYKKDVQSFDEDKVDTWNWISLLCEHIYCFYNEIVRTDKELHLIYEKEFFDNLFIVMNQFLSYMLNFKQDETIMELAENLLNIQNKYGFSNSEQQVKTLCLLGENAVLRGNKRAVEEYFSKAVPAADKLLKEAVKKFKLIFVPNLENDLPVVNDESLLVISNTNDYYVASDTFRSTKYKSSDDTIELDRKWFPSVEKPTESNEILFKEVIFPNVIIQDMYSDKNFHKLLKQYFEVNYSILVVDFSESNNWLKTGEEVQRDFIEEYKNNKLAIPFILNIDLADSNRSCYGWLYVENDSNTSTRKTIYFDMLGKLIESDFNEIFLHLNSYFSTLASSASALSISDQQYALFVEAVELLMNNQQTPPLSLDIVAEKDIYFKHAFFLYKVECMLLISQILLERGFPTFIMFYETRLSILDVLVTCSAWDKAMHFIDNPIIRNENFKINTRVKYVANLEFLSFAKQEGYEKNILYASITSVNEDFKISYSIIYIKALIQIATQYLARDDYEKSYDYYKNALDCVERFIQERSIKKVFKDIISYFSFIPSVFLKKSITDPLIIDNSYLSSLKENKFSLILLVSTLRRNWVLLLSGLWRPKKNGHLITKEACDRICALKDRHISRVFYCKLAFVLEKNNEFEKAAEYYATAIAEYTRELDDPTQLVSRIFSYNLIFLNKCLKNCLKYVVKFDFSSISFFGGDNLATGMSNVLLDINLSRSQNKEIFFQSKAFDIIFFFLFLSSMDKDQSLKSPLRFTNFTIVFNYLEEQFGPNTIHRVFAYELIKTENIALCKAIVEVMEGKESAVFYQNIAQHLSTSQEKAFEYLNYFTIEIFSNDGTSTSHEGNYSEAISCFLQACKLLLAEVGANDIRLALIFYNLGSAYMQLKKYKYAIIYLEKSAAIRKYFLGEDDPSFIEVQEKLQECQPHAETETLIEMPKVEVREKLFKHASDKQAKIQLSLETIKLSNYVLGNAVGQYDCFLDACAQALVSIGKTQENGEPHDIKSLDQLCHNYVLELDEKMHKGEISKAENWVYQKLGSSDTYNDYLAAIHLPKEGESTHHSESKHILLEAFIVCKQLNISIHCITFPSEYAVKQYGETIQHLLLRPQNTERTFLEHQFEINYQDETLIHLVAYKDHIVPLLKIPSHIAALVDAPSVSMQSLSSISYYQLAKINDQRRLNLNEANNLPRNAPGRKRSLTF